MYYLLMLIPGLPLAAAVVTALAGPRLLRGHSHWPTVIAIAGSMICSFSLLWQVYQGQHHDTEEEPTSYSRVYSLWTWASIPAAYQQTVTPNEEGSLAETTATPRPFHIEVTLRADALTAIMLSMVTFVSLLVAIFASGYMHGDPGYWRFFAYISLFVFSMTMLVSVSNFLLLYVFWEAVGVCSYLLIGFWYQKPEASAAGKKAFLVNRIGDIGFALALFLIWTTYGTLSFHDPGEVQHVGPAAATEQAEATLLEDVMPAGVLGTSRMEQNAFVGGGIGLAICLLLLLGACGKSAQFPLHVWLPDAMEGPTPVSALIHAATMVTAGVYMVTRCTPLFIVSPDAQLVVSGIGAVTALLAGLIALTQYDLKRVLAYSTVSQLGYMFLALGTGTLAGITAGMFHLFTHAFFKALLFLGAGSVMHAMGNVIDMRRFGGLKKHLPITHWTFLFGCLALAGIIPFAGFWSKDAVLAAVHSATELEAHGGSAAEPVAIEPQALSQSPATATIFGLSDEARAQIFAVFYYVAMLSAFLTAFYTFRAFYLTFYGEEQIPPQAHGHVHESPAVMWIPLAILAACALLAGVLFEPLTNHSFAHFLASTPSLHADAVLATKVPHEFHYTIAAISTVIALAGVGLASYLYLGERTQADQLARTMQLQRERRLLSPYQLSQNRFYLDEVYYAFFVRPLQWLGDAFYAFDRWIVDGLVDFIGRIPPAVGSVMRTLQMGLVQFYAVAMVLGILILVAARLWWS